MKFNSGRILALVSITLALTFINVGFLRAQTSYKFDFGPGPVKAGYIQVLPGTTYNPARKYGFDFNVPVTCTDHGGEDSLTRDACSAPNYFYFSVDLVEGNYDVTVTIGDGASATLTTVKAESRRLFVERAENAAGKFSRHTFTVNRRNTAIAGTTNSVGVTSREKGGLNWDGNKLTLDFCNVHPSVASVEVSPATAPRQVFLAGNSTQCDWATESETAWGQMITRFFKQGTVITSLAEGGLTGSAFISQRRLDKIISLIKPGDYLLAEFGHNDMGTLSIAQYQANFKTMIDQARAKSAIPVIVTPTPRRTFSGNTATNSFTNSNGDYLAAIKQVAKDQSALMIDLNACATAFIEKLGPTGSAMAYWYNPDAGQDNTHWNRYGALEVAKCMAQGVKDVIPELANNLTDDFVGFDPKNPDPVDTLRIPPSADTSIWHRPVGLTPVWTGMIETGFFSIQMNPDRVVFRPGFSGEIELSVFRLDGEKLAERRIRTLPNQVGYALEGLLDLPRGLYFLKSQADGFPSTLTRFMKE